MQPDYYEIPVIRDVNIWNLIACKVQKNYSKEFRDLLKVPINEQNEIAKKFSSDVSRIYARLESDYAEYTKWDFMAPKDYSPKNFYTWVTESLSEDPYRVMIRNSKPERRLNPQPADNVLCQPNSKPKNANSFITWLKKVF